MVDPNDPRAKYLIRIKAPLVWARLPCGIRIEDIKDVRFKEALHVLESCFVNEEVCCKAVELSTDKKSLQAFLDRTYDQIKDKCSIGAVDETTNELVGVLVLRPINKNDFAKTFSRVKLVEGEKLKKILGIQFALNKRTDVFEAFNTTSYLRFYSLAIMPDWRHKGIGRAMLKAGIDVGRSLHTGACMGLFTSNVVQNIMKDLGMVILNEISYMDWVVDGETVFANPGAGNYSVALMAMKTPERSKKKETEEEEAK